MQTIKSWRDFNRGRIILILKGEFEGHETAFVDMVWKDGKIPGDHEKPSKRLRMKVRTTSGRELLLKPGEFMMVEKKIIQDSKNN